MTVEKQQQASGASDLQAIACNYVEGASACAQHALCYVSQFKQLRHSGRVQILARSRSGRWIRKWEDIRRLKNFRLETLAPEHPRYWDLRINYFDVEALLAQLQGAALESLR
jgi:hypothetical protein